MANTAVCTTCLRTLRNQLRQELRHASPRAAPPSFIRSLTTSAARRAEDSQRSAKPPPPPSASAPPSSFDLSNFASSLRKTDTLRSTTEPYIAYGSTEDLFRACTQQCSYTIPARNQDPPEPAPKNAAQEDVGVGEGWWFQPKEQGGLGLDVTFNSWAQVIMLHMYLLTVRLRAFPAEHAGVWHQNLVDHFFYAAEDRMAVWHGMSARGVRNKYLKDLWLQWRGLMLSYDEGLIKGDAVLGAAVWRNMFKAGEEVDVRDIAYVTAYIRSQLQRLDGMRDESFASGEVNFQSPDVVKAVVGKESAWLRKSFTEEDLKSLKEPSA
ncbi:hypothetical protein KC363_g1908 [Hortaea werneckii]|uniref:Ubiquinol-cytochrome c chaperone domain-containing protein n=1 Tax=Hortaea werneckii TaxID=91943 RepID=A0A3M7FJ72_HORWE|nr:hypothetical protein KC361_g6105 [Hortaea werneckii]KAI7194888.1 hypothetical protein KC363_g1908 [Hortaea werneckii]KAI7514098.1 hypothetical protein KC347_g1012 [Hortaea werneckii]RMY88909.1 hypothetical protein D0861_04558 [Hortaea werneckii]